MKLNHLSDTNLLLEMLTLVKKERALLAQVLWHLKEVDHRKLYADARCGSLFEYCVKVLKYSEGQASRRVSACRLLKELPELGEDIQSGELNLTQLNQAKNFFNEEKILDREEKIEIMKKLKGKTVKETEQILWELRREDLPRRVTLILKEETLEALKKVRGLKGFSDFDTLLMKMSEEVMKIWDPTLVKRKTKVTETNTRYIPVQVRAEVWKRDQGRCKNCGSNFSLELDHIKPFAIGGKTNIENLRLLCRNCNQRKGIEFFKKGPPPKKRGTKN